MSQYINSKTPSSVANLLRQHMPVSRQFAYFDHAAVSPLPDVASDVVCKFAHQASTGGDTHWLDWNRGVENLRDDIARLLGCEPSEVALVANTSTGIGLVAEGFHWRSGDNVVIPENEFPANKIPWLNLRSRGVEVRQIKVEPTGQIGLENLLPAIDQHTRIVAFSWVGFLTGFRVDVAQVVEAVHQRGALVCLDAIQGLGAFPIDVKQCGVDFLAADGHKWMLGPEGAGLLFIDRAHQDRLRPLMVGWNSLSDSFQFDPNATQLKLTAARYEGGATNMVGMLALGASTRLLLDCLAQAQRNDSLAQSILFNVDMLRELLISKGFDVQLPEREHRSGIMTVSWLGADNVHARKYCLESGVVLSVRGGKLRISTHAYNDAHDIHRLVQTLTEYRDSFQR